MRYSIQNPETYIVNNILAYIKLLEFLNFQKIKVITYTSSSSVYGEKGETKFQILV